MKKSLLNISLISCSLLGNIIAPNAMAAIAVTQTTNSAALSTALRGSGLTINSVSIVNGAASQFGTYSGFTAPPVTFGNGIVLSTGNVADTTGLNGFPDTETGAPGTDEFDDYGTSQITNFEGSYNVAALQVSFTLAQSSAVSFDFIFGSVEYPDYTNEYTDAFLVFLDGTTNQISFDSSGAAVQVGTSFATQLTTGDLNTVFTDPHGLLRPLTTKTGVLSAGTHTLLFEVGDVNDEALDSAVFIRNLSAVSGSGGDPTTTPTVPVPASAWLFGSGLLGLAGVMRKRNK